MKKKIIVIVVLLAVFTLIGFRLASNKEKIEENNKIVDRSSIEIPVTTTKTTVQNFRNSFSVTGETEPMKEVDLTVKTSGILNKLNFDIGSNVRKGQYLGGIDVSQLQLKLEAINLKLEKSERDYKNQKELLENDATSENEFINAEYSFESNKVQVNQIRDQISDASIVAPISGVITSKNSEAGEFVNTGNTIASIVDVSRLKTTILVNESSVYKLEKGIQVTISSDIYPDKTFTGLVNYVGPVGDQNHNYPVEIYIDNDKDFPLKAGTFIRVHFNLPNESNALVIPKIALVEGLKNPFVYVVDENTAVSKKIVVGKEYGEYIEVLSGLKINEEVIISGQINLTDGSLIKVINTTQK